MPGRPATRDGGEVTQHAATGAFKVLLQLFAFFGAFVWKICFARHATHWTLELYRLALKV